MIPDTARLACHGTEPGEAATPPIILDKSEDRPTRDILFGVLTPKISFRPDFLVIFLFFFRFTTLFAFLETLT